MTVEHSPNDSEPPSPEQQEWRGQKWEYLVLSTYLPDGANVSGRTIPKGILGLSSKQLDPIADHYNQKIEGLKKEKEVEASLTDVLNLLGNDGWEVVTGLNDSSLDGTGSPFLFLKRPIVSLKE